MNKPIVVGTIRISGRDPIYWTYGDVKYYKDKWAKADEYLPLEFDLCLLQTIDDKFLNGWFTGLKWDGLNVKSRHKIKSWKKID